MSQPLLTGVVVDRMAHGGRGVARVDGRVVFVAGGLPGDRVSVAVDKEKKRFLEGHAVDLEEASPLRGPHRCPAAEQEAGCCDFSHVRPDKELELKVTVVRDQLERLGGVDPSTPMTATTLEPTHGWRTRTRLGVDKQGRAGLRRARSRELVTDVACSQLVPGLVQGIVGPGARRFTPDAEVIAVQDSQSHRHVLEVTAPGRGQRAEKATAVLEGSGIVRESVAGAGDFSFPAQAFWQAHRAAPDAYVGIVSRLLADAVKESGSVAPVGWDLYGGVGLFVPAILGALGDDSHVYSVDYSPAAAKATADVDPQRVTMINKIVDRALGNLPDPGVVVLDPPRAGAGRTVVEAVGAAGPRAVVHIGCDPATLARDLKYWSAAGMGIAQIELVDAFPGTHHCEVIVLLVPRVK